MRLENVAMGWIDNKKIYDMVPKSEIIDCLKMFKISVKVIRFITKAIKNGKIESIASRTTLAEVKIQSNIFQANALSPLLFCDGNDAMMPLNCIFRKCASSKNLQMARNINHLDIHGHQVLYKQ